MFWSIKSSQMFNLKTGNRLLVRDRKCARKYCLLSHNTIHQCQTCPKSLRYNVCANITPDEDFKMDVSHIRRDAEQKLVGALTCFHQRRVERNTIKLRKTEQRANISKGRKTNDFRLIKNYSRPAKDTKKAHENIKKLTETLTKKLEKVNGMINALENSSNKQCESHTCLFSDSDKGRDIRKRKFRNKKHSERRKHVRRDKIRKSTDANQKHIKNFSEYKMTTDQTNLLAKGLKFIPTPIIEEKRVKQQLLLTRF